jgi:hypothetical protein
VIYEEGADKSLALQRKQATGLKKMYLLYISPPPPSSTHLWLRCSNFFNPSKKNSFGCAANRKIGKAKVLSAPLRNVGLQFMLFLLMALKSVVNRGGGSSRLVASRRLAVDQLPTRRLGVDFSSSGNLSRSLAARRKCWNASPKDVMINITG